MGGVLSGLRVLDLSWGISGPLTAMLLGDSGADVVKVEPPGGDRFRSCPITRLGYKVWQRGKRSVELDLKTADDRKILETLVADADILIESFAPGTTAKLKIDYPTLRKLNPRLIYASITAYGRDTAAASRPGYDILVAARSGLNWEHRGWPESALSHQMGTQDLLADLEINYDLVQGPPRPGPMMTASPAPSLGAFFAMLTAIHGALLARDKTGEGQLVETSLLQGAICSATGVWQKAEKSEIPGFNTWIFSSKSAKGHFQASDGRWIHQWVTNPRFIMNASEGDKINSSPDLSVQNDPDRFGMAVEETFVINHYHEILAERVKKFPAADWAKAAAIADATLQEVRPPEEALSDPLLLADGCVRELNDPELGTIRQVGRVIELEKTPSKLGGPAPKVGQDNAKIRAEAASMWKSAADKSANGPRTKLKSPLSGVKVLDLGLAIAGPYGTQLLSDLGADVIKVNTLWDAYWHGTCIAFVANHGKRSLCMDLKRPEAMEILHKLVAEADVVQHNMRYEAAVRLGVDYDSLKKINPKLVYCHTRGHEHGPRESMPGNDQTGACIAGVQYEDGAIAKGGRPLWSLTSFGDTGNGFLSAVGIMQALYHRNRTGEGQFVSTAIVYAQLLASSYVLARPDGKGFDRPRLDRMQQRTTALYGLYETADGWLAIVAATDKEWEALRKALNHPALGDKRFATAAERWTNDAALQSELEQVFRTRSAAQWFAVLDAAGAPCEIADPDGGKKVLENPELRKRNWIASCQQYLVGRLDHTGLLFDFSETPAVIQRPPLVVGECTREILEGLGYSHQKIEAMNEARIVGTWSPGEPQISAFNSKQKIVKDAAAE